MPGRDVTVRAEFLEDPDDPVTFILHVVGEGTVAVNGDAYPQGTWPLVYERNTTLELLASPGTGWQFDGWSGDHTGTEDVLPITMNADKEITATFTQEEPPPPVYFSLTMNVNGNGQVVIMLTDPARMDFLVLYPNPTRTIITVEANQPYNEMRVYNNLGQLMLSASFNYTLKYTSDVRILANGIYYLRITTEKDVRTGKFEVIHRYF